MGRLKRLPSFEFSVNVPSYFPQEGEIPQNRRSRQHITELLQLDEEFNAREKATDNVAEIILRDIKRIYENAVKPLETLYKYRDLSNRHFSDPEIFSKPLILFMGPWSGGKSSILNYLTDNEYTPNSLRTGKNRKKELARHDPL